MLIGMSVDEITAEDDENERLAAGRKAKSKNQDNGVVSYDLAESSISVKFPAETPDKAYSGFCQLNSVL